MNDCIYYVVHSASDGDDLIANYASYEDALGKVVEFAKSRDGLLQPALTVPDTWFQIDPPTGRKLFGLRIVRKARKAHQARRVRVN